ncbi:hypothetical protein H6G76_08500 [Nostoc sp. FACHB-152]|uniref:hypothetical protein n=1 Tax=unclassified Nostoc TaxID=2593658 RepID=UPI0016892362|nr:MULTISPECIES: hypothetical protein [unclassified Nostoc]MBD2447204.1 hypothetical protein [Nostoc sp. FACHB-152]MBD2468195.1 hypothetical protein [Nostoc sp. FACHB-145]
MLSIKWKFFIILVLSIFATAGTSLYITYHQTPANLVSTADEEKPQFSVMHNSENSEVYPERVDYQTIPLDSLNSVLQGSNPTNLALSVIEDVEPEKGTHKIEVVYPQHNQALVTITHIPAKRKSAKFIKYRVEMNTFGRSLLISSPPVWQIIWAGSQIQCKTGSRLNKQCN